MGPLQSRKNNDRKETSISWRVRSGFLWSDISHYLVYKMFRFTRLFRPIRQGETWLSMPDTNIPCLQGIFTLVLIIPFSLMILPYTPNNAVGSNTKYYSGSTTRLVPILRVEDAKTMRKTKSQSLQARNNRLQMSVTMQYPSLMQIRTCN